MLTLDGNLDFWGRTWGFGLNIAKYSRGGGYSSDWLWVGRMKSLDGRFREVKVSVALGRLNNLNLQTLLRCIRFRNV